jgi:hypothetical protein
MNNIKIERPENRRVDPVFPEPFENVSNTSSTEEVDLNRDGLVSKKEEELYEKKAKNRRAMAWVSLIAMVASGFAIMFLIPEARLQKINTMLDLYWISLGGIVGAYVGISTWMSKR